VPRESPNRKIKLLAVGTLVLLGLGAIAYLSWPRAAAPKTLVTDNTKTSTAKVDSTSTNEIGKAEPSVHTVKSWLNPTDGQTYGWIPSGTFTMGCSAGDSQCSDDEKPAHPVDIEKGFWLDRTETTIGAYQKFAARRKIQAPKGDANLPATGVTWAEAKTYCAAVGGRLPSEAEWEYAARGGNAGAYYGVVPAIAWYADNSDGMPHAVGGKKPNAYGLYDMLGNVSEWVLDRYYNKYDIASPATGTAIDQPLASNSTAVARGGFWDAEAAAIRVSHRGQYEHDEAEPVVGFRCANDHI
jgi:formylglycine-generating enzyme required for sulfatase activity